MSATGTAVLDFGAAPGTNVVTVDVTGQAAIASTSHADAWLQGDTTAEHNAFEHSIAPIRLSCGSIVDGTGFTITGSSEFRLSGTFKVHWVWV